MSTLRTGVPRLVESLYQRLVDHTPLLVVIIAAASLLGMLLLRLHLITAYIPELGGIESNVIYALQRLLDGYPLYVDPATAPYAITQYTPLYYYLCWLVGQIAGVDAANVHQVYMLSRGVSLALNLLFALSAYLILRSVFRVDFRVSVLAFAYAFVYLDEESFSRPDSLFNLLALLALGFFMKLLTVEEQKQPQFYLIGSSMLSVMAIFAKQSAVYLPVLLLFYLVFYLQNLRWSAIALLIMTLTFGFLLLISAPGGLSTFVQNVVQGVNNGVSFSWFTKHVMIEHFQKERLVNIVGLFTGVFFFAKGGTHALRFLGLSLLGSFTFALITSVKVGAAPNYFTEFIVLTVIATMVFLTIHNPFNSRSPSGRTSAQTWVYVPFFYLLLVGFTLPPRLAGKYVKKIVEVNALGERGYQANQEIVDFLYQEKHLAPTEQVFVTTHVHDYLNKLLYRNVIFPQKEIVIANPPGVYDYSSFFQDVETGQVAYIIANLSEGHVDTTGQRLTIRFSFIGTDFSPYIAIKKFGDYVVFEHQDRLQ